MSHMLARHVSTDREQSQFAYKEFVNVMVRWPSRFSVPKVTGEGTGGAGTNDFA
jgi:hypothetical protein